MYIRAISLPTTHFFLFGPRGTGKTTWLKAQFRPDMTIDLLQSAQFLEYTEHPDILRKRLLVLKSNSVIKIVIDEIQRVPELLNEVHSLIEEYPKRFQFALTGSSARKLRRSDANLLAGRAIMYNFFPLSAFELGERFDINESLNYGSLPKIFSLSSKEQIEDFLYSYTETYIKEEIMQESLVRNLPNYTRFLKHLALHNGLALNLSNLAREAGITRAPLENYMSILTDTLLGTVIEPIHLRAKVKEVSTPKFYFFDCGVIRSLTGMLSEKLGLEIGTQLETLVLGELAAFRSYSKTRFDINYWGTPSENEVDFILTKGKTTIGVEVKASMKWKSEFASGLKVLLDAKKISKGFVVYLGQHQEQHGDILLLPFAQFIKALYEKTII